MLRILLTRSSTYTSTVKRDFKVHPKVGEQTTQESLQSTNSLTSVSKSWPEVRIPCLRKKSNKEGQFSTVLSTKKSVGSQAELLPINSQPPVAEKFVPDSMSLLEKLQDTISTSSAPNSKEPAKLQSTIYNSTALDTKESTATVYKVPHFQHSSFRINSSDEKDPDFYDHSLNHETLW